MTDDQDYIMKDESMSHDSQSKKMKQALLRLNNDIYEFKCNQFSTKMIDISVSDICNPGNKFSLSVNMTWKDVYFLPNEEYKFILNFSYEYPYTPPEIIMIRTNSRFNQLTLDQSGHVRLEFLDEENWTPILSLNTILFALELLIIEPESSNVNSLDLYNEEKTQRTKRKQSKREVFLSKKETLQNSFNVVSKLKKRKFSQLPDAYKGNRQDTDEADCVNHEIKRFKKLNLDSFY